MDDRNETLALGVLLLELEGGRLARVFLDWILNGKFLGSGVVSMAF